MNQWTQRKALCELKKLLTPYCEDGRRLEQVAQGGMEYPSLEILKTARPGPEQPALADPALSRGVGWDDLQRGPCQPQLFCASVKIAH